MPTVSAHVAVTLAAHVDHVFGVMGNGNAYFLDALTCQTDARFTPVRHEAGAVVAADAFHRASGRLAAATTTYGAGFTNTLTALAEAVQAHVPLVLVVGDEPTSGPRPWDVDQIAMASAVGARTYTVGRADAAATTVIAVEHALTYRVPTVLAIPYDVATLDTGPVPETPTPRLPAPLAVRGAFADGVVREIADRPRRRTPAAAPGRTRRLGGRRGRGARRRRRRHRRADRDDGARARDLPPGRVRPRRRRRVRDRRRRWRSSARPTSRVVVGASLNQFTMRFGDLFAPGCRVFQVDVAPAATHPHVGGYVRGDAAVVAEAILKELDGATPSGWRESVDLTAARRHEPGDGTAADGRLDPRSAAARLAELLPEDRVVVSDGGHFLGWSNMYWPVSAPDRMVMVGTAFQAIGLGFPSVVGAALARPEATVVLTTGDGGGLMALSDLESAVRVAGGRGIAVVWNDGAYSAEMHLYGRKGLAQEPMLIPDVDFAGVATALGAQGVAVRSVEDLDALTAWRARPADRTPVPAARPAGLRHGGRTVLGGDLPGERLTTTDHDDHRRGSS